MKKVKNNILYLSISFFVFALVSAILFSILTPKTVLAANVESSPEEIKVFVGSTSNFDAVTAERYVTDRAEYLQEQVVAAPNDTSNALVVLNDFFSVSELNQVIGCPDIIEAVYIWVPNKTGRAIIKVEQNNIAASIQNFFSDLDLENETDTVYKQDMEDLMEDYGIFAVAIRGSNSSLSSIQMDSRVAAVDVLYNPDAEAVAARSGKSISYICVPDKPDGTH